jgi:diguanylate cyclase (GGDEF)-like protein/PAS domain S-box-containing protein
LDPEAVAVLVPTKTVALLAGLRAGARPRDLLGRVQLLLLALALLSVAGVLVGVAASGSGLLVLRLAGLAAGPILAATWLNAYRRRAIGAAGNVLTIGALFAIAVALDDRWDGYLFVLFAAAVIFTSGYGSLRQVLVRTAVIVAIQIGEGISDPAAFTTAIVFAVGFVVVACLMSGMVSSVARYEGTARREQVLAATGLDLVAATDLGEIAAAAVESGMALCGGLHGARVSLAMVENHDSRPLRFEILASTGEGADEMRGKTIDQDQLAPRGHDLADQRMLMSAADDPASTPVLPSGRISPFHRGEVLLTRVSVAGTPRGVLIVESPEPISEELPSSIRALATQVALAISRDDLQKTAIERQSSERFEALIQASSDVISIATADGRVRFQSPSVKQAFGYATDEIVGRNLTDLVHPDDCDRVVTHFRHVVSDPSATVMCECRIRHADGSWRDTETRISNLMHVPAVGGIVLNTRDITKRHALEAELRHQAFHDSLTGLANRALFINRVEHSLAHAKRHGSSMAVLYCDMHGFNRLNDSLGYSAGESALLVVAERLRTCVRGEDTVARLGGDEFGLLLDGLSSHSDATLAMERIMATLRQPVALPGAQVELQPHIGIVISNGGEETAEDLLRDGAVAMHQARNYEGGYALFDPEMHADAIRRIEVESELRTALDESEFVLHYQPTVDLRTGRLTGVEALVRWQHPRRGLVPPMEFIPMAEESGLIVPLGQWTITEACRQVRLWQSEIPADEPIALNVNLSARQLRHPNIVRDIADALDDTGLLPSRLVLEITESVLMVDTAATLNRLFQLKSLGVRLAVDDFGTGYSSFAYLRRFPVDILKIDKSFVDGVATEPTASALVDAMIRIGKTLRLETVAEGVEKVEQADRLRALQCDIGQGYLFSRPLPADQITTLLRERSAAGENGTGSSNGLSGSNGSRANAA